MCEHEEYKRHVQCYNCLVLKQDTFPIYEAFLDKGLSISQRILEYLEHTLHEGRGVEMRG